MMVNCRFAEIFLLISRSPLVNISCREIYRVLTYRMSGANISCLHIEKAERGVRSAFLYYVLLWIWCANVNLGRAGGFSVLSFGHKLTAPLFPVHFKFGQEHPLILALISRV